MGAATTIWLSLILPLVAVALILMFSRRPNVRETSIVLCGAATLSVLSTLVPAVLAGERPAVTLFEVLPGLSIAFRVEPLGMLFSLVASGLWVVVTFYCVGYMRGHGEAHQTRFYACFAIAIFAALGVAFARNMFTLFFFYEVLTVSTYPLVTHHGDEKAMRGGRTYLSILLSTSVVFLLLAMVLTWDIAGTLEFREGGILFGEASNLKLGILLALYAFGTGKAALMPFHRWLPAAMVAPTPVSALLHAVAVVKVGVFTVLKVGIYIFGLDLLSSTGISIWLMYVAAATIIIASLVALSKDNLKARLAYSTVSQLAYIVLGTALANQAGIIGGGMHLATHAFGKITLFLCAGAIFVATHKTEISDMRGIGRAMPVTLFAFLLGSLSVIGLPPFGGSWSKLLLALGAAEAHQLLLVAVLMISSLLNVAYLLPVVVRGYFSAPASNGKGAALREAPLFCLVPLCVTAVGCLVLFFFADKIYGLLAPIAQYGG